MYLSQLILNPQSRQVRAEIANCYELHRTIMQAFHEQAVGKERVLFRLDIHPRTGVPFLLVQSTAQPVWEFLTTSEKNYLLPGKELEDLGAFNPATKFFEPQFSTGQIFHFRLKANPTVKKDRDGKKQGRRVGLFDENDQTAWLKRKLESAGAELLSVRTSNQADQGGHLFRKEQRHVLTIHIVQFDGVLRVIQPDVFLAAVQAGIGSAKGFGCGLLSLARA